MNLPQRSVHLADVNPAPKATPDLSMEARHALRDLTRWYLEKHAPEEIERMRDNDTWGSEAKQARQTFQMFGEDLLVLRDRLFYMEDYEHETLRDLRDRDISIPDLVDYVRAESGFNPDNKPVRADVSASLRKREFLAKSARIEDTGRSAALAAGAVAMVGLGGWALLSGFIPGGAELAEWVKPAWNMASDLVHTAAGGGAMMLAWKGWKEFQDLRAGTPKLEMGKSSDFADLPNSLGNTDYRKLNEQYEAIPTRDKHLIKHLSPTELRMFLTGQDYTRLHILRSSPPPHWAKVQSRLEEVGSATGNRLVKAISAAWTVISSPWHRDRNNARIPDIEDRMNAWRSFAKVNRTARRVTASLPKDNSPLGM